VVNFTVHEYVNRNFINQFSAIEELKDYVAFVHGTVLSGIQVAKESAV